MQTSVSNKNNSTVAQQIQIKFASAVRVIKTSLLTSSLDFLWPDASLRKRHPYLAAAARFGGYRPRQLNECMVIALLGGIDPLY